MLVHVECFGIQGTVSIDTDDPLVAMQLARELVGGGTAFVLDAADAPLYGTSAEAYDARCQAREDWPIATSTERPSALRNLLDLLT